MRQTIQPGWWYIVLCAEREAEVGAANMYYMCIVFRSPFRWTHCFNQFTVAVALSTFWRAYLYLDKYILEIKKIYILLYVYNRTWCVRITGFSIVIGLIVAAAVESGPVADATESFLNYIENAGP